MLVAANPADFRLDKTENFTFLEGDILEIKDLHARPKGISTELTRGEESEPESKFIPIDGWCKEGPKTWPFIKLTYGNRFIYRSGRFVFLQPTRDVL